MSTEEPELSPALIARLAKREDQHKYDHGHAVILGGGPGHGGAARLAARAALRVGAGLVTLGCPAPAIPENAAQLNAIMLRSVAGADALDRWLEDSRLNAIGLGPGLGATPETRALVRAVLAAKRATVLDADALTAFAGKPEALFDLLHSHVVLTPHMGEFGRIFPHEADEMKRSGKGEAEQWTLLRRAAGRAGCTLLLKGARTRIADAAGHEIVHDATGARAVPWLATAGAGDVLAGMITGLLARGYAATEAAQVGVFLHARAARAAGPGLIAEDLPEALPAVFRDLGI